MSAKGRGAHRGGEHDYYPTPAWCVDRLLDNCGEWLLAVDDALEPSVGDGAIVRAVEAWRARAGHAKPIAWTGVELRRNALDSRTPLAEHVEGVDFRLWQPGRRFGLALGNPPFVIFETVGRDVAMRVLPQRPSFDGEGTDSCAYAWFVWNHPQIRGIEVLGDTPIEVRNAQKPGALLVDPRQCDLFAGAGV